MTNTHPKGEAMSENYWSVTVSLNGEKVVTIEPRELAGREIGEAEEIAIRTSAEHLLSFIGSRVPPPPDRGMVEASDHMICAGDEAIIFALNRLHKDWGPNDPTPARLCWDAMMKALASTASQPQPERDALASPSKPAPVVDDKDDTPANVDRMDERGFVTWASSEEGGGPDVGITVGLGADLGHLWLGDITRQRWEEVGGPDFSDNDMGWWLIHYAPGKEPDVLGKILEPDHEPAREFLEHVLAPLLATSPNRPQATEGE